MTVTGWRAYYDDGREYDSESDAWVDIPDDGLLILVLFLDRWSGEGTVQHRTTLDGEDWYFHEPGTNLFGANSDPREMNERRYPNCVFKRGKWAEDDTFYATKDRAYDAEAP